MAMGRKSRMAASLSKTQMCKFFAKGKCSKEGACQWAHDASELKPVPDLSRTKMCRVFRANGQCDIPDCPFAHNRRELRQVKASRPVSLVPGDTNPEMVVSVEGEAPDAVRNSYNGDVFDTMALVASASANLPPGMDCPDVAARSDVGWSDNVPAPYADDDVQVDGGTLRDDLVASITKLLALRELEMQDGASRQIATTEWCGAASSSSVCLSRK
eukprot:TRINITY_DN7204_c0_g1_i1.p1 TRINITY_DN7204_c0_g1~~TRINITY_DN7204_c0_g1_i1.p1  ORF type:complete len:215 (-),score=33.19 TRINITY_DN7204_c0_g1_i1:180-824(-)